MVQDIKIQKEDWGDYKRQYWEPHPLRKVGEMHTKAEVRLRQAYFLQSHGDRENKREGNSEKKGGKLG